MAQAQQTSQNGPLFTQEQEAEVLAQLDRLLESKLFRDTTRMKRFLRYVTEEVLEGRGARLKGYTIGVEVFDRPDDFDPQADTIVRVQAGRLRRRLDLFYADEGADDPVRFTIPKGRYAPCFEFRAPRSTSQDHESSSVAPLKLVEPKPADARPGVAVLTFEDFTQSDSPDFFAEGLTAEIVGALVQFRHLRVVVVRPTAGNRTTDLDVRTIGERYDTQFVLSGSVRRSGDVFRVAANLIDTVTGQVVFQKTYDRGYRPDTMFEIQESVASYVAAAIAAPFGQINRHNWRKQSGRRQSLSAYEAVLRYYGMGLAPRLDLARDLLRDVEQVTREHPTFSSGFAIRSLLHVLLCTQCIPSGNPRENFDAAQTLAAKAINLDTQNALGYFAAFQAHFHDGETERGDRYLQRALALNPNDYAMLQYVALTASLRGDIDVSVAFDDTSRRLIATPPRWFEASRMTRMLIAGSYEAILEEMGEVSASDSVSLWFTRLSALGHAGLVREGREFFDAVSGNGRGDLREWQRTLAHWQPSAEVKARIVEGWAKVGLDR